MRCLSCHGRVGPGLLGSLPSPLPSPCPSPHDARSCSACWRATSTRCSCARWWRPCWSSWPPSTSPSPVRPAGRRAVACSGGCAGLWRIKGLPPCPGCVPCFLLNRPPTPPGLPTLPSCRRQPGAGHAAGGLLPGPAARGGGQDGAPAVRGLLGHARQPHERAGALHRLWPGGRGWGAGDKGVVSRGCCCCRMGQVGRRCRQTPFLPSMPLIPPPRPD